MMHICWIWQVLVPLYQPAITREIAAELWMIYRAGIHEAVEAQRAGDPQAKPDHPMEVQAMQRWSKELFLLYSQAN